MKNSVTQVMSFTLGTRDANAPYAGTKSTRRIAWAAEEYVFTSAPPSVKISASRTYRAGSQFLRQIYLATLDLELHDRLDPGRGLDGVRDTVRAVAAENTVIPPLPEDRFLCSFSHIFAGGYAAGREIRLSIDGARRIKEECYLIKSVSPELRRSVPEVSQFNSANRAVRGVWPEFQRFRSLRTGEGRLMTEDDEREARRVVVLGYESAQQLYPGKPTIGATLLITPVVGSNDSQDGSPVTPNVPVRCKPLVAVTWMLTADPSVTAWLGADRLRGSGIRLFPDCRRPPC